MCLCASRVCAEEGFYQGNSMMRNKYSCVSILFTFNYAAVIPFHRILSLSIFLFLCACARTEMFDLSKWCCTIETLLHKLFCDCILSIYDLLKSRFKCFYSLTRSLGHPPFLLTLVRIVSSNTKRMCLAK